MFKPLARSVGFSALFLLAFSAASGAVIEADHPVFGPGSLTRDSAQGLDFLDLTESVTRSFNDVSSEFGVGGDFEGFRYATLEEVVTLINNFGFSPEVPVSLPLFTAGATPSESLRGLIDLLGATRRQSTEPIAQGLTSEPAIAGPFTDGPVVLVLQDLMEPNSDFVFDFFGNGGGFNPAAIDSGTGSFLVVSTPVPEPGLAGDYNNDGRVSAADYTMWRDNHGEDAGTLPNDFNGGVIGLDQYQTFVANFGAIPLTATSNLSTVIPEPASLVMLVFIGPAALCHRLR